MKFFLFFLFLPILAFSQSELQDVEQLLTKKQPAKAEKIIVPYVESNPNDLKAVELLGDTYGQQLNWDGAIKAYKQLVNAKSNNANYYYKYGGAMGMKALTVNKFKAVGMIGDIKEAFLKSAELDPKHIDVRWALVELYMQLPGIIGGSVDKALKYANELEKLSKVDGYLAKGFIYGSDNQPGLAEKNYKMAIKEGGSMTCYEKLTAFYEKQKQPEKAIANIEENHKAHQKNILYYEIGKVAAENNVELQKGEMSLKTYLINFSKEDSIPKAWANYRLAQINKHKKNKTEALKYIDLAITELPNTKLFKEEKTAILKIH